MTKRNFFQGAVLAASILVVMSASASAVEQEDYRLRTTKSLYNLCSNPEGNPEFSTSAAACNSFIKGVVQYHDGVSDEKHMKRIICYPQGATIADGDAAFVAWAEKNMNYAQLMSDWPVLGLVKALKEKYPCAE
jgi:hypothetical protein